MRYSAAAQVARLSASRAVTGSAPASNFRPVERTGHRPVTRVDVALGALEDALGDGAGRRGRLAVVGHVGLQVGGGRVEGRHLRHPCETVSMGEIERLEDQVRAIARSIVSDDISERQGAGRIWVLLAEANYPEELHEARVGFVGPLSEWDDHPEGAEDYAGDIRDSAERFAR